LKVKEQHSDREEMAVNLEDLTPEQIEKGKACRTPEELLALAKEEGVELTDDQLDQISGGDAWGSIYAHLLDCAYCGNDAMEFYEWDGDRRFYRCPRCGGRTWD
jgi:hypothetical protein